MTSRSSGFCSTVVSIFFATLAACGSTSSGGTGSVTGTVESTTFTVASVIAIVAPTSSSSCSSLADGGEKCTTTEAGQGVGIVLTNNPSATCATLQASLGNGDKVNYPGFDVLELAVGNQGGNVSAGTYSIVTSGNPTKGSSAEFTTTTAKCAPGVDETGTAGSVTLTSVSASSVSGSYSVTFGKSGSFSGSFDVPVCPIPDGGFHSVASDTDGGACQQ
jgi:hypothetical protein